MDGVHLQEDQAGVEFLGCQMQANLKWHSQVAVLEDKLRSRLTGLMNLKFIVPFATRKTITDGVLNSVLVYCLPLFGGCDAGQVKTIQILQNKAARLVCHAPPWSSRSPLFDKLAWLSVNQLISYHSLISVFKIKRSREPEYLANSLNNENVYRKVIVTNTRLGLATKSFTFRGAQQWNQLPLYLRNTLKIGLYKKGLRKWILANIPRFIE